MIRTETTVVHDEELLFVVKSAIPATATLACVGIGFDFFVLLETVEQESH